MIISKLQFIKNLINAKNASFSIFYKTRISFVFVCFFAIGFVISNFSSNIPA